MGKTSEMHLDNVFLQLTLLQCLWHPINNSTKFKRERKNPHKQVQKISAASRGSGPQCWDIYKQFITNQSALRFMCRFKSFGTLTRGLLNFSPDIILLDWTPWEFGTPLQLRRQSALHHLWKTSGTLCRGREPSSFWMRGAWARLLFCEKQKKSSRTWRNLAMKDNRAAFLLFPAI